MKILHLVDHIKDVGNGITNVAIDISIGQREKNCEVFLMAQNGNYKSILDFHDVNYIEIEPYELIPSSRFLSRFLKDNSIDIVHIHTPKMAKIYILSKFYYFGSNRVITTIHNSFQRSSYLLSAFNNVVCLNDVDKKKYSRLFFFNNFHKVINGTLNNKRQNSVVSNSNTNSKNDKIKLISVANMCYRKGIDVLIDSFYQLSKKYKNISLSLVGDGEDINEFKKLANKYGVENKVNFYGRIQDPSTLVKDHDIFILASRRDPCPLVLFEAMVHKVAIVGRSVDGITEQLAYGKYGLLFDKDSELTELLDKLITNTDNLDKWKNNSLKGTAEFNLEETVNKYLTIYKEILNDS